MGPGVGSGAGGVVGSGITGAVGSVTGEGVCAPGTVGLLLSML